MSERDKKVTEYQNFSNPYKGLAAMILFQADYDIKALGQEESSIICGSKVSKTEIKTFLNSKWATVLASNCGLSAVELSRYIRRVHCEL